MNDMPQDAWFYSREGERIGPVTFSDLQIKARESGLNPRLDLVWTQGMAEWKPAGEIEGLFERRGVPELQESLAPSAPDPYRTPEEDTVAQRMGEEDDWPGVRRRGYIFSLFIPALWSLAATVVAPFLRNQFGNEMAPVLIPAVACIPLIFCLYFGIQRFPNLGMSRWWYLANFVPFLNIWTGYRCFACPAGYAYHKKLDGVGIFLAIIYWLFVLLAFLVIAAVIAVLLGGLGSPEIREQMQEAIRRINEEAAKR